VRRHDLLRTAGAQFCAAHDALNQATFALACILTTLIALALPYEIVARYFFNAPTDWASPLVSYSLVAAIFLAMPELTRQSAHITITTVLETLDPRIASPLKRFILLIAAAACMLAAWFSGSETIDQFLLGIHTIPPMSIPKWIVTCVIPYGMLSSAIYFLRQFATGTKLAPMPGNGT